jgi:hypothetical protein
MSVRAQRLESSHKEVLPAAARDCSAFGTSASRRVRPPGKINWRLHCYIELITCRT